MAQDGPRILARTMFQQMLGSGYSVNQILSVSSELIGLLTNMIQERRQPESPGEPARIELQPVMVEK